MRDQNLPPAMNNMLIGVITSDQLFLHSHLKSDATERQGCSDHVKSRLNPVVKSH